MKLWNHLCIEIESYRLKDGGDVKAIDWQSLVNPADKAFAIDNALLGVAIVPLPEAEAEDAYALDDADDSSTIQLRASFSGRELITTHVLRSATPAEISRYRGLMSRALLVRGTRSGKTDRRIPSRAIELARLYDEMKISASGYVGRVPIHHKTAVILRHPGAQQEIIAGN